LLFNFTLVNVRTQSVDRA